MDSLIQCFFFSFAWKERKKLKSCSRVRLLASLWTVILPGSSIHGIFQAKVLEWVTISFSRGSFWPKDQTCVSWTARLVLYCWANQESPFKMNESESCSVMSNSLQSHGLYSLWNFPGQNTGVGSQSFLQEILRTQELNPGLLHCRHILYWLSYEGSPNWTSSQIR